MRLLAVCIAVVLCAVLASAAEPPLAMRPMPQMGTAAINEDGNFEITSVVARPVWEWRTRQAPRRVPRTVDGERVTEERMETVREAVCKYVSDVRVKSYRPRDFWVFKDGAAVDVRTRAALLNKPAPVLFTASGIRGERLDPFYQQFLKSGVLVVCVFDPPPAETETPRPSPAPGSAPR